MISTQGTRQKLRLEMRNLAPNSILLEEIVPDLGLLGLLVRDQDLLARGILKLAATVGILDKIVGSKLVPVNERKDQAVDDRHS